jgi:hypothetical protein
MSLRDCDFWHLITDEAAKANKCHEENCSNLVACSCESIACDKSSYWNYFCQVHAIEADCPEDLWKKEEPKIPPCE